MSFNPTRVRLKRIFDHLKGVCAVSFNPTRVRLKRWTASSSSSFSIRLQPHKGSSETPLSADQRYATLLQPHKGSSETRWFSVASPSPEMLQPHKGSSETLADRYECVERSSFNPTRVRLKPSESLTHSS